MAISFPFGSVPGVFKHFAKFSRYKHLKGYYYVCSQQESKFANSPEGTPNFVKISIGWLSPSTLRIVSRDFDRTNFNRWKTWTSEITMNGHAGTGRYVYDIGNESGIHEVILQGKDKIIVRVIDTGKADWKRRKDNEPASQVWIRVNNDDPMLKIFKKLLS